MSILCIWWRDEKKITLSDVIKRLEWHTINDADCVVYCGGEPTMHEEILDIIRVAGEKGAYIHMLTNGRKLSDFSFAKQLIDNGLRRISIPLYGSTARCHDQLTQVSGSFTQTIDGLKNLFSLRDDNGYPIDIEIKTLVCKQNIKELQNIVEFIVNEFPSSPTFFTISSMDISDAVKKRYNYLFIKLEDAAPAIRECIDYAIAYDLNVTTYFIPACVLGYEYISICDRNKDPSDKYPDIYYAPDNLAGVHNVREFIKPITCKSCKCYNICDGIWRSYAQEIGTTELKPL